MKSLIIGSNGMVGRALSRLMPQALKTIHDSRAVEPQTYMDITKYESIIPIFEWYRPQVVYLPASITNVDECENFETNKTNIKGATTILRLCEQFEAKLVYFSSGYVFDGESEVPYNPIDETHPINNYGRQKETMEHLILQSDAKFVIVRTIGVFGTDLRNKNFVKQIALSLFGNKKIYVPDDQWMNPIWSADLARVTVDLVNNGYNGVFHVAGDECMTKADFAKKVERYYDLSGKIIPVHSKEMNQKAARPKMGCLDPFCLEEIGMNIPSFAKGLAHYLDSEE